MDEVKHLEEVKVEHGKIQYVQVRDIFTSGGEQRDQILARFNQFGGVTLIRTIQKFDTRGDDSRPSTETQFIDLDPEELKALVDWWEKAAGE